MPTAAGTYVVKAEIAETTNYNAGTATKEFTIAKAGITPAVSLEGWTYGEESKTPSLSGNAENGTVMYAYKLKGAEESAYKSEVPTAAGTYVVKAEIAGTANYNAGTATKEFTIAKAGITPTVLIEGWTYGAESNTPSVSGNAEGGTVTYKYKLKGADDSTYTSEVPAAAGTYVVKAEIAGTANYNAGTATKEFTIAKAGITPAVSLEG